MDRPSRMTRSQTKADAPATTTTTTAASVAVAPSLITPDVARRIEESRLRARAIREQRDAELRAEGKLPAASTTVVPSSRKRPLDTTSTPGSSEAPAPGAPVVPAASSNRDGRLPATPLPDSLRPAKKFARFVDYNMSAMTDTKGGFLSAEDDPTGEAARLQRLAAAKAGADAALKPAHMTDKEWERLQIIRNLQRHKAGPFEPGVSVLEDDKVAKKCRDCGSRAIDWVWEETFGCCVCAACKEGMPEKYSLLTKTECREDYLLTEPELRDPDLLPHLSRPNPHKSHWHDMMLFLRFQVEDYALGPGKWGSAEALDAEFERRETDKKKRKEAKFKEKLMDLKRKTRTEAFRRQQAAARAGGEEGGGGGGGGDGGGGGGGAARFGDRVGGSGRHVHDWGRAVENGEGVTIKKCLECGMEVEEMEF